MKKKSSSYLIKRVKSKSYEEGFEDGISENIWLMTFSDLFSLLLVFFVILLMISVPDQAKMKDTMDMIQKALKSKIIIKENENVLLEDFLSYVGEENLSNVITIEETSRGIKLIIASDFSFEPGKAILMPEQKKLLDGIAPILRDIQNKVEITAHTDITPITTEQFPSNWELSAARASAIANYLVANWDVQGARFLAIGSGEFRPRHSPPNTFENMKKNRRLEIEVINTGLSDRVEQVGVIE